MRSSRPIGSCFLVETQVTQREVGTWFLYARPNASFRVVSRADSEHHVANAFCARDKADAGTFGSGVCAKEEMAHGKNENATEIRLHQAERRICSLSPVKVLHPLGHNLRNA